MLRFVFIVPIFGLFLLHIKAQNTCIISPQEEYNVGEGSTLEVQCISTVLNANPLWDTNDGLRTTEAKQDGKVISTLRLENIATDKSINCKCGDKHTTTMKINVFKVETSGADFQFATDARLSCQVTTTSQVTYSWKKGDEYVKDMKNKMKGKSEFVSHSNGTLEILHPVRDLAGVYTCIAAFDGKSVETHVVYTATPFVLPFDKSKNLVQDEKLVIECEVKGYPKPNITWFKDDKKIEKTNEHYKLSEADKYNGQPIDNAKLEIPSVGFDDEGNYMCQAHDDNINFKHNATVLVRVKDKLAALWPFLGIVAEVVILCTIIFIYEKKRNKDAAQDDDANMDGAVPEKKSEGVRHRGSANPRA